MSISGISTGNSAFATLPANRDRQVTVNADGSKSLEVTTTGANGGSTDKTITRNADGGVTFELSSTTAAGTTTDKTIATDGNGGYTGSFSLAGANGATASIQSSGTVVDGTLEFNRALSYTLAGGTSGTRTVSGSAGDGSFTKSVEGQGSTTAGATFSRDSTAQGTQGSGGSIQGKATLTSASGNTDTLVVSKSTDGGPVATPDA